ncbi:hypothetical protein [Fibrobacter sp. UWEL]|uniref:hypothetical protein n=1 Tax=Fibrobacter sp. UWEL TaxID=1896209 RepID=UPI00091B449C|nr:hypothetical protein [Fibrobacter sp. UWEL]SHL33318.1 hypothetical protein SAMN05720468_12242 [Fibrobacter sp. UWEL]
MKLFLFWVGLCAGFLFVACSDEESVAAAPLRENVIFPDTFVEDGVLYVNVGEVRVYRDTVYKTRYVDTVSYTSFIFQRGKELYDTVTVKSENADCDIQKNYFECTVEAPYYVTPTIVVYQMASEQQVEETVSVVRYPWPVRDERCTTTVKSDGSRYDRCIHVMDTIFVDSVYQVIKNATYKQINSINYGKGHPSNFIPYTKVPKFSVEDLRAAFDTLDTKDTLDFGRLFYSEGYSISSDDLPEWAYAVGYPEASHNVDTVLVINKAEVDTVYGYYLAEKMCFSCPQTYPLKLVTYKNRLWNWLDEPLESDTTITWTAIYTDINGVEDSVEVTTVFLGK